MYLPDFFNDLFTINPAEPFKTGAKIIAMLGTLFTIATTLTTKVWPWYRARRDSRSVSKRIGAELFPAANIERSLRYYIPPMCQDLDPAGGEEPRLVFGIQQKLFDALDKALTHPTEYNFIILLADSGMGKTSALLNYYVRHIRRWKKPFKLALIPLNIPDADVRIEAVPDKAETVIFLDALDEDTLAIVDHIERLRILLKETTSFHRVLISCRTQFFARDEEIPKETGKLKVGSRAAGEPAEYLFHKIYLSPFSDEQVLRYIKRRYPLWQWRSRRRAREMVNKIPHLTARPMLLAYIDVLVQAKREIKYSFELYEEMVSAWLERERGFIQKKDDLLQFSKRLAADLFIKRKQRGSERIQITDMVKLAQEWNISLEDWKLSGRSLLNRDADGNYKFAHRSIMEFLFVRAFLEGHQPCLQVPWTDQMLAFFWEIVRHDFHSKYVPRTKAVDESPLSARLSISATCDLLKYVLRSGTENLLEPNYHWLLLLDLLSGCLQIKEQDNAIVEYFAIADSMSVPVTTDPEAELSFNCLLKSIVRNTYLKTPTSYTRFTVIIDTEPWLGASIRIKGPAVTVGIRLQYPFRPAPSSNVEAIWLSLGSQIMGLFRIQYAPSSLDLQERIEEARRNLSEKTVSLVEL